jgi:hypothetical protein
MGAGVGAGIRIMGSPLGGRVTKNKIPTPNNTPTIINAASHHEVLFIPLTII